MDTQIDSGEQIVRAFLQLMEANDIDGAVELLDPEVVWINLSLPTVRGRERVRQALRLVVRSGIQFRAHLHHVVERDGVVLTERTDQLGRGRFEPRFWVYGRFEVADGRIRLWRDSFDWFDVTVGLLRGVAGVVVPRLNRPWPDDRAA